MAVEVKIDPSDLDGIDFFGHVKEKDCEIVLDGFSGSVNKIIGALVVATVANRGIPSQDARHEAATTVIEWATGSKCHGGCILYYHRFCGAMSEVGSMFGVKPLAVARFGSVGLRQYEEGEGEKMIREHGLCMQRK
jgi:hypothetical protein